MRFLYALNAILTLAIWAGKNFSHFIDPARHILMELRFEDHSVPDLKRHRLLAFFQGGENRPPPRGTRQMWKRPQTVPLLFPLLRLASVPASIIPATNASMLGNSITRITVVSSYTAGILIIVASGPGV
jgi:hypothetical protein